MPLTEAEYDEAADRIRKISTELQYDGICQAIEKMFTVGPDPNSTIIAKMTAAFVGYVVWPDMNTMFDQSEK